MIPIAQGVVTVYRDPAVGTRDDYDDSPAWARMGEVRAVLGVDGGGTRNQRAQAETVRTSMISDVPPWGIRHTDLIVDWRGQAWAVEWVQATDGFGLDHCQAGLVRYEGVAP